MSQKPKSGTAARIETFELKPSELAAAIQHLIAVNLRNAKAKRKRRGLMIWGGPGVGKSALAAQAAHLINYKLLDIRLTTMEPTDLRGIPVPVNISAEDVFVKWAIPAMFPNRYIDDKGMTHRTSKVMNTEGKLVDGLRDPVTGHIYDGMIIILDELPNAAQSVQAGSYQLVLDGALGEWVAPDNCVVIAAGNRETDRASTFKMPKPLENRFTHLNVKADYEDWVAHAVTTTMHPDVIGYVSAFKSELYKFDPKDASRGFPTPRSWDAVSDIIEGDPNLPEQVMLGLISGTIGDGIAVKFMEHRKHAARLPKASDVLDGRVKEMPDKSKETSLMYSLTTSMCYELQERHKAMLPPNKPDALAKRKFANSVDNFLGFMMTQFIPEMVIMGARTALQTFKIRFDPTGMTQWKPFSDQYQDLILRA